MFTGKLMKHQSEIFEDLLEKKYAVMALDMGLGKSILSLSLACKVGKPTLIVCPAYLRKKWDEDDVSKFTSGGEFKIISYSELTKNVDTLKKYDFVIADEAHYLKGLKTKRTKAFHEYIVKHDPEYLYLLTGTPIKNRIPEFFSLLQLCYYGGNYPEFTKFYRLYYKYCETFCKKRRFTIHGREITQYYDVKNIDFLRRLIKPIYFRKKSSDAIDLPKQNRIPVTIKSRSDYDNKLLKAYEKFEKNPDDSAYMTLKAANAYAKTPATIELAQNITNEGKQVIVFTDHVASCQEIASQLGVQAITGEMASDLRSAYVSRFKKGESSAIVATIGTLSAGENLQCANYMIFNDLPYVPSDLSQAEKRIHRIGQDKPCFYYYMFTSEVDKKIYDNITQKLKVIKEVNNE